MSAISFDDLFALRVELSDQYMDENIIIRELKMILLNNGFSNINDVNNYLVNFYKNFGIDISLEVISNIQTPQINVSQFVPLNILNQLINQAVLNDGNLLHNPVDSNNTNINNSEDSNNTNLNNSEDSDDDLPDLIPDDNITMNINNFMNNFNNLINNIVNAPNPNMEDVKVTLKDDSKIKKYKLEKELEDKCSICMGKLNKEEMVWELPCKHVFHEECIKMWLKEYNYKCPVCRKEAGEGESNI